MLLHFEVQYRGVHPNRKNTWYLPNADKLTPLLPSWIILNSDSGYSVGRGFTSCFLNSLTLREYRQNYQHLLFAKTFSHQFHLTRNFPELRKRYCCKFVIILKFFKCSSCLLEDVLLPSGYKFEGVDIRFISTFLESSNCSRCHVWGCPEGYPCHR